MDNKKNTILLTVIAVATLLVAVVGATFAYFTAQGGEAANTKVKVETGTAASAAFDLTQELNIYADAINFADGKASRTGTATGTVTWIAPGATADHTPDEAERSFCYTVDVTISSNNFVYTQADETAELLLNVTKGSSEITEGLSGLTYATVNGRATSGDTPELVDLKGWDITKVTNGTVVNIPGTNGNKHKLVADAGAKAIDTWKTSVTLVNLNADQTSNTGKTFEAKLNFTKVDC